MTTQLHQQRAALQSQLDSIDLAALHQAIADAESAAADFAEANTHRRALPDVMLEMTRLRGAADQARREQQASERGVHRLVLGLTRLDSMLNADTRIQQTEAAIKPAQTAVADAQAALACATQVLTEVDSLLIAERTEHDAKAAQSANTLLEALRNGKTPTIKATTTAMLDALTHAQATATVAMADADASLINAQAALADAVQAHRVAITGLTARELEDAARAYAQAVVTHEDACWACRAHFDIPDHEQLVLDAKREAVAELEDAESEAA